MNFADIPIHPSWKNLLKEEFEKPYMLELQEFLKHEVLSGNTIFPPAHLIFNALYQTPFEKVKIVLLGQDPYHGPNQAEGLCFSVPQEIKPPPSLQNIFKELISDLGIKKPSSGSLLSWAKQGALLLNCTLSVRKGEAKSHFGKGWEIFTDKIIQLLYEKKEPIVFLLWGKPAIDKLRGKMKNHHLILTAPHPSPLSAYTGFFGCAHFSQSNQFLKQHGRQEMDWSLR